MKKTDKPNFSKWGDGMRLIDADKFIEWLDIGHLRSPSEICFSEGDVKVMIDIQPTIEAVPVVHGWIPCSERLPEKRDWYLAVFKEPDTGFIGLPYIADYLMGKHTAYTTNDGWIIKDCTDICNRESLYHKNLECVAWMPLPEPYTEQT